MKFVYVTVSFILVSSLLVMMMTLTSHHIGHLNNNNNNPAPVTNPLRSEPVAIATATATAADNGNGNVSRQWKDWPAVAYSENGHSLVAKGDSFYNHAREHYFDGDDPMIEEFLRIYKNRPDPVNLCGIRINHAMGLFLAVKKLRPTLVVESGVNAGVSTYFIRQASGTTKIFAVDPLEKPICNQGTRWIDNSDLTTYYTGNTFVDIMDMDWSGMIQRGDVDPKTTLLFLDDHLHAFQRMIGSVKHGIQHFLIEDNYKLGEGATHADKIGTPKQMMTSKTKYVTEGDWLAANMRVYSEFPPLVPPIVAKASTEPRKKAGGFMVAADTNTDIMAPILRPDLNDADAQRYRKIALDLELDHELKDRDSYMQFMNYNQFCYIEILKQPDSLV